MASHRGFVPILSRIIPFVLVAASPSGLLAAGGAARPHVVSVDEDDSAVPCLLKIMGSSFGATAPTILLDGTALTVDSSSDTQVVAEYDCAKAPADYELIVRVTAGSKILDDRLSLTLRRLTQ